MIPDRSWPIGRAKDTCNAALQHTARRDGQLKGQWRTGPYRRQNGVHCQATCTRVVSVPDPLEDSKDNLRLPKRSKREHLCEEQHNFGTIDRDTLCRSVGIGRRTGLKIRRTSLCVWVQVPPPAPSLPLKINGFRADFRRVPQMRHGGVA
jgi:hypothetical protein